MTPFFVPLADLQTVTDIMRELSRLTDPDDAAELYGNGLQKLNLVPRPLRRHFPGESRGIQYG